MPLPVRFQLTIERPVAGGRMLGRHNQRVVFVAGAIPGERVQVRVERETRGALWAQVEEVLEASADRRPTGGDPACGGLAYAHVHYSRQRALKGDVIVDAFRRIGRTEIARDVPVRESPDVGYRLRARLHVRAGRAGFFRENTHTLCDAASTSQLSAETMPAVDRVLEILGNRWTSCDAILVAENVANTERVLHLVPTVGSKLDDLVGEFTLVPGVTGVTTELRGRLVTLNGSTGVTDTAAQLFHGESPVGPLPSWTRRASSFFQGNRFLAGALARHVLELAQGARVLDLYAGVGLFAVTIAARGDTEVVAVEGDPGSSEDLSANASAWRAHLRVVRAAVEETGDHLRGFSPDAVIVDPPRTGLSPAALGTVLAIKAARIVYVSCDPPTLARDAAKIRDAGYTLHSIEGFDLFPNTAHVETVVAFDR
jgi:23S rRNA (uracil1939-C5)-methyltransferase